MVKVSVMYPNSAGVKFDMTYYLDRHLPMVRDLLGAALKGMSAEQGLAGGQPGAPAPYVAAVHMTFDSVDAFQAAFGPHTDVILADIPNYTNSQPTIQIGQVKL